MHESLEWYVVFVIITVALGFSVLSIAMSW